MEAIFSFRKLLNWEEFHSSNLAILAELAVKSASKYHKTVLYTHEEGAKLFAYAHIKFDEVILLPEIEKMKGDILCLPKIYAMMAHKTPYVHLDFDVWSNTQYSTKEMIGFGHAEVDLDRFSELDSLRYIVKNYLESYERVMYKYFEPAFVKKWKWGVIPNHSVTIVNNPNLVKSIYSDILTKLKDLDLPNSTDSTLATFVEQFLLARYLDRYNVKYDFMYDQDPFTMYEEHRVQIRGREVRVNFEIGLNKSLEAVKYAHFHGYRRFPGLVREVVRKLLKRYKQII
jgi:hypothetical protein